MKKPAVRLILACLALLAAPFAAASPEDEVRQTFERFVAAQNAHDVQAVGTLLLDSSNFLWITRGTPVWGRDAALKRFSALYEGTWQLAPEAVGAPGQAPQTTRFLMNQLLVKTSGGWKIANLLPIPAPAP